MKGIRLYLFSVACMAGLTAAQAQPLGNKPSFSRQDSLRGGLTPERAWWDVVHYDIRVQPDFKTKTIRGQNRLYFQVTKPGSGKRMQLDLQTPMEIDSILFRGQPLTQFRRDGHVWYIDFGKQVFTAPKGGNSKTASYELDIYFHGKPREAVRPPWDGGWIWKKDRQGRPWMTVACQGLGASVWYPCKDYQGDEPDAGASLRVIVPDTLAAVANGKMQSRKPIPGGLIEYSWSVTSPINSYNLVPYIGKYVSFADQYIGETEKQLDLTYWVLDYNLEKAKKQFNRDVKPMLKAFEYWFGPYPFYADGFQLVETPHLGMEHQSAIAYGNNFMNGYMGNDLSGSGWGLKWDYIIIHEAGHEWFGNNITTRDIADMWVHEGFTMYSEVLFTEYHYGKAAADAYLQGIRRNIRNDKPLIGPYGVNQEGSGDMYNKGASLLHTIRQVIRNDSLFRSILRGLNRDFYHSTVSTAEVEQYISAKSGRDFGRIFDQYLRTTSIPRLEYRLQGSQIRYRWTGCVAGFDMPLRLEDGQWLYPTNDWQTGTLQTEPANGALSVDKNFYVVAEAEGSKRAM